MQVDTGDDDRQLDEDEAPAQVSRQQLATSWLRRLGAILVLPLTLILLSRHMWEEGRFSLAVRIILTALAALFVPVCLIYIAVIAISPGVGMWFDIVFLGSVFIGYSAYLVWRDPESGDDQRTAAAVVAPVAFVCLLFVTSGVTSALFGFPALAQASTSASASPATAKAYEPNSADRLDVWLRERLASDTAKVEAVQVAAVEKAAALLKPKAPTTAEWLRFATDEVFDGEENAGHRPTIRSVETPSRGDYVLALGGNEIPVDEKAPAVMWRNSEEIWRRVFTERSDIKTLTIQWYLPTIDAKGDPSDEYVMKLVMDKKAASSVNWDTVSVENVPYIAAEYKQSPLFNK